MNLNGKSGVFVAFLLIAAFVLPLIPPARAVGVVKEWTSTSDFDAGTKTSNDGNFKVETNTDNIGIASNRLELASIKGDSFAFADADANTWRWDLVQFDVGSCAARNISGGVLNIEITQNSYSACGIASRGTVSGDWEVSMKEMDIIAGSGRRATICVQTLKSYCGDTAGGNYGVMMYVTIDTIFRAFKVVAGVGTQIGGDTTIGAQTTTFLRIVRESQYFHFLYSLDGVLWVQIQQVDLTAAVIPSSLYMVIQAENNGATDGTTELDDFIWAQPFRNPGPGTGSIDLGGYQTSGAWTSSIYAIGTYVVGHIALSTEDLTATENVDYVKLYQNGTLAQQWTDDLTSGTLHIYNVTSAASYNITVEIGLKGIGSATPVVTAIGLFLDVTPPVAVVNTNADQYILLIAMIIFAILMLLGLKVPLLWTIAGFILMYLSVTTIHTLTNSPWVSIMSVIAGVLIMLAGAIYSIRPESSGYGA